MYFRKCTHTHTHTGERERERERERENVTYYCPLPQKNNECIAPAVFSLK